MNIKRFSYSALAAAMVVGSSTMVPVSAATDTTTFQVTATVNETCEVAAQDLAFGAYDPTGGDVDATTTITATCTAGTNYEIELNDGNNSGNAGSTTRAMTNGTDYLDYELYTDSARTTVWNTSNKVTGTASGTGGDDETVYGEIPGGQFVDASTTSYSDTINVTLTF